MSDNSNADLSVIRHMIERQAGDMAEVKFGINEIRKEQSEQSKRLDKLEFTIHGHSNNPGLAHIVRQLVTEQQKTKALALGLRFAAIAIGGLGTLIAWVIVNLNEVKNLIAK